MSEKYIWKGLQVQVRFREPDVDLIENWRRTQAILPTMAATVRGLALLGLKAATDTKPPTSKDAA